MTDAARIEQLAAEAEALEDGPAKVAALEEAVRIADTLGLEDQAFEHRQQLVQAGSFGGCDEVVLPAFVWCLAKSDSDPERFPVETLLWQYKWVLGALDDAPDIPVAKVRELVDDYERRLVANGYSARTALYYRMCLTESIGDSEQAWQLWLEVERLPRDRYSNCSACEHEHKVRLLAELGRYKEAVVAGRRLISGKRYCAQIPERSYGVMIRPLIEIGDDAGADRCYQSGYPMVRSNPDYLPTIAKHLAFLVRRRRRDEALELAERHASWAEKTWNKSAQLQFLRSLWLLARWLRLEQAGELSLRSYGVAGLQPPLAAPQWEAALQAEIERLEELYHQRIGNHCKREERERELAFALGD